MDSLGHRRWIIYPPEVQIGTGSTDFTNALDVVGGPSVNARLTEYVAWPPPGFVPYRLSTATWSFAYPDAEFSNAAVSITSRVSRSAQTVPGSERLRRQRDLLASAGWSRARRSRI